MMRETLTGLLMGLVLMGVSGFGLAAERMAVDINSADAATLAANLSGIGLKRAEQVVAYRTEYGPFRSVDDLKLVRGIGPSIVEKNREWIVVGEPGEGQGSAPAAE